MDAAGLDGFARKLAGRSGRRSLVAGVAGALAAALVGDATAGKHKKKATLCLNGQTVKASSKKKKKRSSRERLRALAASRSATERPAVAMMAAVGCVAAPGTTSVTRAPAAPAP